MIDNHSKLFDDNKVIRESLIRQTEKIEGRIQKYKTQNQDDLTKAKDELTLRIDELEKNQQDYVEVNGMKHNEGK